MIAQPAKSLNAERTANRQRQDFSFGYAKGWTCTHPTSANCPNPTCE